MVEIRFAYRHSPAIHRLLEADGNSALYLVVDFLVHTGHGNEDGGMKLAKDSGHVLDKRTIGNGDATIEFSKIDMARGDMGERKKADGKIRVGLEIELFERNGEIRGNIAVREHGTLGNASGAAGVDQRGEIVWGDLVCQGIEFLHALLGTCFHESGHGNGFGFRGRLVHEDDGLDKGLRLNGPELGKLCGGGDKGCLRARVTEEKRNLLGGESGVDGYGGSAAMSMAKSAIAHSGRFSPRIATRSPCEIPCSRSAWTTPITFW